jgi:hypothetical protein
MHIDGEGVLVFGGWNRDKTYMDGAMVFTGGIGGGGVEVLRGCGGRMGHGDCFY